MRKQLQKILLNCGFYNIHNQNCAHSIYLFNTSEKFLVSELVDNANETSNIRKYFELFKVILQLYYQYKCHMSGFRVLTSVSQPELKRFFATLRGMLERTVLRTDSSEPICFVYHIYIYIYIYICIFIYIYIYI